VKIVVEAKTVAEAITAAEAFTVVATALLVKNSDGGSGQQLK